MIEFEGGRNEPSPGISSDMSIAENELTPNPVKQDVSGSYQVFPLQVIEDDSLESRLARAMDEIERSEPRGFKNVRITI